MEFIIGALIGLTGGLILDYQSYTKKYDGNMHRTVLGRIAKGFAIIAICVGLFMVCHWLYNI